VRTYLDYDRDWNCLKLKHNLGNTNRRIHLMNNSMDIEAKQRHAIDNEET